MVVRILQSSADLARYSSWISSHPHATLWQSLAWKNYQEALGRTTRLFVAEDHTGAIVASALVIIDRTTFGMSTWDIPRGPIGMENGEWTRLRPAFARATAGKQGFGGQEMENILKHIIADAKSDRCLSLYFSPIESLSILHSQFSTRHEHPPATRIIDLSLSEEKILKQMHPKGRYNIHVAQRHGVLVERSEDIDAFYALLKQTSDRDGFTIGPKKRYEQFLNIPGAFLLLAHPATPLHQGFAGQAGNWQPANIPIAALLGIIHESTGIYYYGASDYAHRALMAPFLLQWEAMLHCKAAGCRSYDLLGIAPDGAGPDHPWAGVSTFKAKFGGTVVMYPPEQCIILRPWAQRMLTLKRAIVG